MTQGSTEGTFSARAKELWLFALRNEVKVGGLQVARLRRRNRHSKDSVICSQGGPAVSVTTYGHRLKTVYLTLESIGLGSKLPSRLILWVDTEEAFFNPPPELERLIGRGLEIRMCENFGPHTKYYPYLLSQRVFLEPLVTADDDQLYSRWWLEGLMQAHRENPEVVNCYRAHRIGIAGDAMTPYRSWSPCRTTFPSFVYFATGVSGVIYPPSFLERLKGAGSEFMSLCPKQDDAWLHVNALRAGVKTRQILSRPLRFPFVPGSQTSGLFHTNVLLAHNDHQIVHAYAASDVAVLRSCASQC